jgi:hypothetical protein
MPRLAKIALFLLVGTLAALVLLPLASQPQPSALYVHINGLAWTNVTVQSANLPQAQRFDSSREMRIGPISHGIYRICVQLSDGRLIWSEFFHADAGVRRRVDVFLAPSSNPDCIHFRETANQKDVLFEGETRPSDATEQKPFRLNWI